MQFVTLNALEKNHVHFLPLMDQRLIFCKFLHKMETIGMMIILWVTQISYAPLGVHYAILLDGRVALENTEINATNTQKLIVLAASGTRTLDSSNIHCPLISKLSAHRALQLVIIVCLKLIAQCCLSFQ